MTQLLFQHFSQSIGCCARLNRRLSYCCGAHWLFYFFLKVSGPHISENFRISFLRSLSSDLRRLIRSAPAISLFSFSALRLPSRRINGVLQKSSGGFEGSNRFNDSEHSRCSRYAR